MALELCDLGLGLGGQRLVIGGRAALTVNVIAFSAHILPARDCSQLFFVSFLPAPSSITLSLAEILQCSPQRCFYSFVDLVAASCRSRDPS